MSEFANFESAAVTEEDPAAAFLAREQDQMAELEGDAFAGEGGEQTEATDVAPVATPVASLIADEIEGDKTQETAPEVEAQSEPNTQTLGDDMLVHSDYEYGTTEPTDVADMFGTAPEAPVVSNANYDFLDEYESVPSDPFADPVQSSEGQDPYASISQVDKQLQEPEKIRIWREEQKERLAKQDAEAEVKKEEWREIAKRELEDWYKHREEQLEKSKANNREAEAAFCQERDESIPGHEWERVTRLCEFNPKAARNAKDVSRMRSILLQLKQTPLVR